MFVRPLLSLAMASTMLISGAAPAPKASTTAAAPEATDGPTYTADKQLVFPEKYREWVYLTSGVDMNYNAKADESGMSMFGNVFVNPSSYREFLKSGTWPDGTAILIENRGAIHGGAKQASLNKHGLSQTEEYMGMEVHVKDSSQPGGWGFYAFGNTKTAKVFPQTASCYTCHAQHAAVDTTFVQFYPTLLPVARTKGTLSKAYLSEMDETAK
jgi:hypothetical protein